MGLRESLEESQKRREDFSSRRWFLPGQNRAWRYLRSKRPAPRKTRNCLTVFFAFVVVCILRKLSLEEMLGGRLGKTGIKWNS